MRSTAVKTRQSPTRCPFCHDAVRLREPWVVCRGCLARHHSECWALNSACSSCGGPVCLKDASREPVRVRSKSRPAIERARGALYELEDRFSIWAPVQSAGRYLGSVATAGLLPVILAEADLSQHLLSEMQESGPKAAQRPVFQEARWRSKGRGKTATSIFAVCALTAVLCGFMLADSTDPGTIAFAKFFLFGSVTTWIVTLLTTLVAHHRAVRRHDAAQLAHIARDQHARQQLRLANLYEDAWTVTAARLGRGTGVAAFLSTLCFPIAYVILPLWLARAFQVPLEVHERRLKLGDLGS